MEITVASIMTSVGSIFTTAMSWVGTVATTIGSNPILLVFTVLPLIGLGIGLFRRLKG